MNSRDKRKAKELRNITTSLSGECKADNMDLMVILSL